METVVRIGAALFAMSLGWLVARTMIVMAAGFFDSVTKRQSVIRTSERHAS